GSSMTPRLRTTTLAIATAAALAVTTPGLVRHEQRNAQFASRAAAGRAEAGTADVYGPCDAPAGNPIRTADDLLAGRYTISHFGTVAVPLDPRWNENPVKDPNWEFNFHALRYLDALWDAWIATGQARYRDRYAFMLRDWFADNPRSAPPSRYSWNDHATAWRGVIYACALTRLPRSPWLVRAALE